MWVGDVELPATQVMADVCAFVCRVQPPPLSAQHREFAAQLADLHSELHKLLDTYYNGPRPGVREPW